MYSYIYIYANWSHYRTTVSFYLLFSSRAGPPSEPAGVHGYMKNMEVHLLWTPGSNHGADILFYNIEYMSLINPEWRTVYTSKYVSVV